METRKILIASTKTQKRYELNTDATTLGELKAVCHSNNIDYSGMDFTVAGSGAKTVLTSDDALLPTNVVIKGKTTNDLIVILTNTRDKVSSGCTDGRSRRDAYAVINDHEWLKDAIKDEFGVNYTLITTENLWLFIDDNLKEDEDEEEEEDTDEEYHEYIPTSQDIANHIYDLIKALAKTKAISYKDVEAISELLEELAASMKEVENKTYSFGGGTISDDDIDDMIADM